ncbi:MAG: AAA family ATPase [Deltaproteobacteria bacterium]|nr:AAA family ATPase [Deltaproteobacteria bacterium]
MGSPVEYPEQIVLRDGRSTVVSRGVRTGDGLRVIIKRLRWQYPPADQVAAFEREYALTRRAACPQVVAVHELSEADGVLRLILEDFGATEVGQLYATGPAPLTDALDIGIAAAGALVTLHRADIIHKDINPTNLVRNPETGVVKLIDFGLSTTQRRQTVSPESVGAFAGTPRYVSPEQTGRTEVSLDWRSDLYSLGATLYHLLVGRPPFVSEDRLELIHAHIARTPEAPHDLDPRIPRVVSDLVMRCLQKRPDRRYQSASGLLHDLVRCREALTAGQAIPAFELGERDRDDHLRIPERLYGRQREVAALMGAFQRAASGARELLLIAGYSGIGKTSLVYQVLPSILQRRGGFVSGKCEQFSRGVPYASIVQAFRSWLSEVSDGEAAVREMWRARIAPAVAPNGRLLTDLIAELGELLGPQPPVEEVSPAESQNRLFHTMGQLVRALAGPEHPLVLFLDDLQWADRPSLELIVNIARDPATTHMLLLGAYRDNEVDATHPLALIRADIEASPGPARALDLGPLGPGDVRALIADALAVSPQQARPLAQLCHAKTAGNPFFLGRFLVAMHERGHIALDPETRSWGWDLDAIAAEPITDNVVDLMCAQIDQLPSASRQALLTASVVGGSFGLETLARLLEQGRHETQTDLRPALDRDLVRARDSGYWDAAEGAAVPDFQYRFQHDRVQQAAYLLLPEHERRQLHLSLAHLLGDEAEGVETRPVLFDIVEHLNRAGDLIRDAAARRRAAALNLAAGRRAFAAAAFAPAHGYLERAIALCDPDVWERDYELAMATWLEAARAAYVVGDAARMDQHVQRILTCARTVLDRVRAMTLEVQARNSQSDLAGAMERALEALAELGIELPAHPTQEQIAEGLGAVLALVGGRSVAELVALPERDDPTVRTVLQLENLASVPAFLSRPALLPILAFDMVRTSLERGICPESPYGFGLLGLFLCAIDMSDVAMAHAEVTLGLLGRFEDCPQRARATHLAVGFVKPWNQPLRSVLDAELRVFTMGVESGDLEYACWGAHIYCANSFWAGVELEKLATEFSNSIASCKNYQQEPALHCNVQFRQAIDNLMGLGEDPTRLVGPHFDEREAVPAYKAMSYRGAVAVAMANMTVVRFVFGDHAGAAAAADEGLTYGDGVLATYIHVGLRFYGALAHLSCAAVAEETEREAHLAVVAEHRATLAKWSGFCAENHAHRVALVDAEVARVRGDLLAAMDGYDAAIGLAARHQFVQDEAIAGELAGRFHLARGKRRVARAYLLEARFAYQKWGASAKVDQLAQEFPDLAAAPEMGAGTTTTTTTSDHSVGRGRGVADLDLASVAKALSAIGAESRVAPLLTRIVEVAMENAGATQACLLLDRNGALTVEAALNAERTSTHPRGVRPEAIEGLLMPIVAAAFRSGEPVLIADARSDARLRAALPDDRPRSVLAVPVEHQGTRSGVLYLDNDLIAGAFTDDRLLVMQLLATQAAITLEKARLLEQTSAMATSFERFVPTAFLAPLSRKGVLDIQLGDAATHQAVVLFSDLRGVTRIFEGMPPAEGFALLNHYLGRMTPIVEQHGGFIDKFVGDAIMALFLGSVDDAVSAVVAMSEALRELNRDGGLPPGVTLAMGTGLHAGAVTIGTVGSAGRLDVTALGDTVNSAARIETLTKALRAPALITEEVQWRMLNPTSIDLRPLGPIRVYGREEPLSLLELFAVDEPSVRQGKRETLDAFAEALAAFRLGDFLEAEELFGRCVAHTPGDTVAAELRDRARRQGRGSDSAGPAKGDVQFV